jgi:hypothetical protein
MVAFITSVSWVLIFYMRVFSCEPSYVTPCNLPLINKIFGKCQVRLFVSSCILIVNMTYDMYIISVDDKKMWRVIRKKILNV